jgi:hypothetical protein
MYYITANPNGIEGIVREVTTIYATMEKVMDFLRTKTALQCSRYYVREVDASGKDSGLILSPDDIERRLSGQA